MHYIGAGSAVPELEFLVLLSVSQGSLITFLVVWQIMLSSCGLLPFQRLAQFVPMVVVELRMRFSLRYWLTKVSRLNLCTNQRPKFIPPVIGFDLLLHRDGLNIFDFFKTFSFNDVSPPAPV
ncbi:MAG: hypothetical protein ONB44_12970 [candidate division KSB1 bacterium]|nr:hypothetical protein [candidate division KSB1 bacterium]MDZ7303032.1 hypothetical protein [candidate division KSB1 bacterium]MDZ7312460.1 hypothetical protein [candidate division KSB1 bacterium]